MSDLGVRTTKSLLNEDQRWIAPGGIRAMADADTVSIDVALFSRGTFPNALIPSGVLLAKVTATGLFAPYADATEVAQPGTGVAVGFLLTTTRWDVAKTTGKLVVALYWHGEIIESLLPTGHGLDAAGKTDLLAAPGGGFRIL